ncbi:MAG: lysylphosphatidylglycerol synthase domain-containing protein [Planctomycetota bacterium]
MPTHLPPPDPEASPPHEPRSGPIEGEVLDEAPRDRFDGPPHEAPHAPFNFEARELPIAQGVARAAWARRVLGVALALGALAWAVTRWPHGAAVAPGYLAAAGGLAIANLVVTAALHRSILASLGPKPRLGLGEMVGVTAMSGVMNYLPAPRAGLVGRAVYLKTVHGYPLLDSARATIAILVLSLVAVAVPGTLLLLAGPAPSPVSWTLFGLLLAYLVWVTPRAAIRTLRVSPGTAWSWLPWRLLDWAIGAARLALCFAAVGAAIDAPTALALAAGWAVVKMTAITPQGLGVAEWAVIGLAALTAGLPPGAAAAAALLDRLAEAAALALGALLLGRKTRAAAQRPEARVKYG